MIRRVFVVVVLWNFGLTFRPQLQWTFPHDHGSKTQKTTSTLDHKIKKCLTSVVISLIIDVKLTTCFYVTSALRKSIVFTISRGNSQQMPHRLTRSVIKKMLHA